MKLSQNRKTDRRGSTLVATLLLVMALSGLAILAHGNTERGGQEGKISNTQATAQSAAEYGAELAVSLLASGVKTDADGKVEGDWVSDSLYEVASSQAADQRRIRGVYDDQEFRVRVRSARLAHENNTRPDNWLVKPDANEDEGIPGYKYGYHDVYEITSTARFPDLGSNASNPAATSVVRTLVELNHKDSRDDLAKAGAVHNERPENFQVAGDQNLTISGEDHYLTKYYVDDITTERIITPLKLSTNEANYFGAYGGYWSNGCLTLNYQLDPEHANPYRPRTRQFGTGVHQEMKVLDSGREPDTYLLGGKESRTVTLDSSGKIRETK